MDNVNHILEKVEGIEDLLRKIDQTLFSIDIIGSQVLHMSAACEQIFGYTSEEFMADGKLWLHVIYPDDMHIIKENEATYEDGKSVADQFRIIHKNGSIRWVERKIIPQLDEEGKLTRADGIMRDITKRKIAEERALEAEKLILEAQQLGKIGNFNANIVTGEVFWSDGMRVIMGVDKNYKASLEAFISMVHPEDKERFLSQIMHNEEIKGRLDIEYRIIRVNDKQVRAFYSRIDTVKDKKGNLARVYGILQDITERKQAEEKVEKLNMLIYQMSHDLRGPINSAKNYIYLASAKVNDKTALDYIGKIHASYRKIEDHLMSLLNLQRINRAETIIEKIDMEDLIENITRSIDNASQFNKVRIFKDIHLPDAFYSDKQYLHSILYNLINNAMTYSRPIADAYIYIKMYEENDNIIISVADNGIGMDEKTKSKIFELFFKGNSGSSGTGMGLYIIKGLVENLKGTISVESAPMEGTTFTICLPNIVGTV